jgi:thioredoxin reductase
MGLAAQVGNTVTLSYRKGEFTRIKDRNAKRIDEHIRSGKLKVLFNSAPVEFRPESVVVEVNGQTQEIANDYVWVLAGGTPPNEFLKKIGVEFGAKDLTLEASSEVKQASVQRSLAGQAMSAKVD